MALIALPACAEDKADGAALYQTHCLTCHQANGKGVPRMQPPISGSEIVTGYPDTLVAYTMLGSGDAPGDWANAMPGYDFLSNADLAALLTYVRVQFGEGGAITPAAVADVRSQLFDTD
ncbi:MAG: c-type cytochrome [Alphaproteobacteria bacterium]